MSSDAAHTAMISTRGDIAAVTTPASLSDAQSAIPGLPDHLVIALIIRSEYFGDPADFARLRMVSPAMRDAVAATGRHVALTFREVLRGGYLDRLLNPRDRTTLDENSICPAAASAGKLEWARANGCPWDSETGADVNKTGDYGDRTPLYCTTDEGHVDVVKLLIKAGADINREHEDFPHEGATPLHFAIWNLDEAIVRALVEAGADVNKENRIDSGRPLHLSTNPDIAQGGHAAIIQMLRDAGAW